MDCSGVNNDENALVKDECLPEETNRRIVDIISDVNLAYSEHARRYLHECGLPKERTYVTGSPMAEVLHQNLAEIEASDVFDRLGLEPKKYILLSLVIALVACQRTPMFTVEGTVSNAEGEMLYLEHTGLVKTVVVDSCTLKAGGEFSLTAPAPQYPDFYRLRVGASSLPLAVDSTETITITVCRDSLPYTTAIEGSDNSLIMAQLRAIARNASREQLRD